MSKYARGIEWKGRDQKRRQYQNTHTHPDTMRNDWFFMKFDLEVHYAKIKLNKKIQYRIDW